MGLEDRRDRMRVGPVVKSQGRCVFPEISVEGSGIGGEKRAVTKEDQ